MSFRENDEARYVGVRPGHKGEQIRASGSAANGTSVLYTVPTGYTLFITTYWAHVYYAAPFTNDLFAINTDAAVLWHTLFNKITANTGDMCLAVGLPYPIEVPDDYVVYLQSANANSRITGGFTGWLEKV